MKTIKPIFLLLAIIILGCDKNLDRENILFSNYVNKISSDINLIDYHAILIIPVNRCSSCVSIAAEFAKTNHQEMKKLLIIVNDFRSVKELRLRFGLSPAPNLFFDSNNYFKDSGLDFGNVGFYLIENTKIITKEIVNPSNVNDKLQYLKTIV